MSKIVSWLSKMININFIIHFIIKTFLIFSENINHSYADLMLKNISDSIFKTVCLVC